MRSCHFCDSAADSKEHAWPKWLASQFRGSASVLDAQIGDRKYSSRSQFPEVTVRSICSECNNGWMSKLENDVRPTFDLLLSERRGALNVQEMHAVAAWVLKSSMVFESIDRGSPDFYTPAERAGLRKFLAIPEYTWIWVAGVRDFGAIYTDAHRLSTGRNSTDTEALLTTFAFGNFAAQILTLRPNSPDQDRDLITFETREGPWDDIQVRVWPHNVSGARWPKAMGLGGSAGVERWAKRFSPSLNDI